MAGGGVLEGAEGGEGGVVVLLGVSLWTGREVRARGREGGGGEQEEGDSTDVKPW